MNDVCSPADQREDHPNVPTHLISRQLPLTDFDAFSRQTTIAVILGFFRNHGYLQYNVRVTDFMEIISKYIIAKEIKITDTVTTINIFDGRKVIAIDALKKQFIVAITKSSNNNLLSL